MQRAATTEVEDATAARERSSGLLRRGSRGEGVADVQTLLNSVRATPSLTVDGAFGTRTETAVRFFQGAHRLVVDGIVGGESRAMLERESALHGGGGRLEAGPCHTSKVPGPDDAFSSAASQPEVAAGQDTAAGAIIAVAIADAGAPPTPAPPAPDLVVQLTSDDVSDGLASAHAGGAAVVKVASPDALRDLLAAKKNIGRLTIVSHARTDGQIQFAIGTSIFSVPLSDLAAKVRKSANVREIVFLGCTVGNDPGGLDDMKRALDAKASEGVDCHIVTKKIGPLTAEGAPVDTEDKFQKLSPKAKAVYAKSLREAAVQNRGNCLVQLQAGQTLAVLSDDQLRAIAMRQKGALFVQFTEEDGTCWKDLKFGGPGRCHRVQAK
ncbi:peptidoglycan-binding domain-containing protein [Lentzea sp.]|uniref:peptidoglycan-binding domain-containing protein n=1 Tax=Lentzea sp. TaxID=56099 RepID=UPI002D801084|nr:peptidoglycan-binding domain-containing protein [Lentzea sp.]